MHIRNLKNILRAAVVLPIALTAFSSCSNGKSEDTEQLPMEDLFPFEAVTDIQEGRPDVYVILKVMTNDYWKDIIKGVTDSGNESDCNIYIGGMKIESEWKLQELLVDEAYDKKADAVVFAPANSSVFEEKANRFHDAGIPLVLVDTMLTSGYYDVCYMTDNYQAGELAAVSLLDMLHKKGYTENDELQVAIQVTTRGSQTLVDRIAGFNNTWVKQACPSWTVIDEVKFNGGDSDLAVQNGHDFLDEYQNIKAFVACNNSSAVGFAKVLQETERKDIVLSAFDYSDIVAQMIADDEWDVATVVQKQYDMGYYGVKSALDLLKGEKLEHKFSDTGVMVINEGNYKDYENGK